jgi:hypothetical protein
MDVNENIDFSSVSSRVSSVLSCCISQFFRLFLFFADFC